MTTEEKADAIELIESCQEEIDRCVKYLREHAEVKILCTCGSYDEVVAGDSCQLCVNESTNDLGGIPRKVRWYNIIERMYVTGGWPIIRVAGRAGETVEDGLHGCHNLSQRAIEVMRLDHTTVVGRSCHFLMDLVESVREDWRPPLLDAWFDSEQIDGNNDHEKAFRLMLILLHG